MEGGYFVTIARWNEHEMSGSVQGNKRTYQITLREHSAHCECEDSKFHHTHCKHVAMLALTLVRASQDVQERYHLGDIVSRDGNTGKVIAVSGDVVSVAWNTGRIGPVNRQALQLAA
jgi:hypothetical protein